MSWKDILKINMGEASRLGNLHAKKEMWRGKFEQDDKKPFPRLRSYKGDLDETLDADIEVMEREEKEALEQYDELLSEFEAFLVDFERDSSSEKDRMLVEILKENITKIKSHKGNVEMIELYISKIPNALHEKFLVWRKQQ
jgi:hypothetical protein